MRQNWEMTFVDMLTLLVTFFVFILSVSVFKSEDYNTFWHSFEKAAQGKKAASQSNKFDLIKGLDLPRLQPEAEVLLQNVEEIMADPDFQGVKLDYNENKISLMVSEQLVFGSARSGLKDEIKPLLAKLVPLIQGSKFNISVEGHSDSTVSAKIDNIDLSLDRALSVARHLISKGLDSERISVSGYGPYRPIADNKVEEGRALNRRVEIHVIINN